MKELVTEMIGGETYQYHPLGEHVVRAIGVCGGRPTFKYTRIEITGTLERLASGESLESIVQGYRGRVSCEAILEASRLVNEQFLDTLPTLEPVG
ncbi:MAG: hypothetical protein ETSY2_35305 [Candidatus Entotheonella gemina]|uniref:DUF433 domain-containing protein n=1 Tax=Candidatus Entotheonella gemina TaxID=1429439 RepID=W4LYW1_9BACT|nr:MAG: hypothetical protein ETSY2_35305 [Candidatus Entotheonella gemina]